MLGLKLIHVSKRAPESVQDLKKYQNYSRQALNIDISSILHYHSFYAVDGNLLCNILITETKHWNKL